MAWKRYPAYRDSGVAWLGEVPEGWTVDKIKNVTYFNPESLSETTPSDYPIEYIDISNVDSEGHVLDIAEMQFSDAPSRARRVVKKDDTIISTVRTYLKAIAHITSASDHLIASTGFAVLRPRRSVVNPKFLCRAVQEEQFVQTIERFSTGVSYPAIAPSVLSNLPIPIPPLSHQETIAAVLDRETTRIDALLAKKERLIALLQEKRAGLISHAVTKGLDPSALMKDSGIAWLGEVPVHWDVAPLHFRYSVQLGKMLDSAQITGEHLAPYLRNVDVQWDSVNVSALPEMDFSAEDRQRFALKKGDLLVCEGGEVGRTAIWNGQLTECYYQKALHRVRPIREDASRYLYYCMVAAASMGVFEEGSDVSTIGHLTAVKLRKHHFPFPPIREQIEIANHLDREMQKLNTLISAVQSSYDLLKEYRAALISAAVTGKIDVRGEVPA